MKMRAGLIGLVLCLLLASGVVAEDTPLASWQLNEDGHIVLVKPGAAQEEAKVISSAAGFGDYDKLKYENLPFPEVARNPSGFKGKAFRFVGKVQQQTDNYQSSPDADIFVQVGGEENQVLRCSAEGFLDWNWDGAYVYFGMQHLSPDNWVYIEGVLTGTKTTATANGASVVVMPELQIHSIKILK